MVSSGEIIFTKEKVEVERIYRFMQRLGDYNGSRLFYAMLLFHDEVMADLGYIEGAKFNGDTTQIYKLLRWYEDRRWNQLVGDQNLRRLKLPELRRAREEYEKKQAGTPETQ